MQKHDIRKITNRINNKAQIEEFLDSDLFLQEFPSNLRNLILNSKEDSFKNIKKLFNNALNMILFKFQNIELIEKTEKFFCTPKKAVSLEMSTEVQQITIDDSIKLISDLKKYFNKDMPLFDFSEHLQNGWMEFCLNQGITRVIPLNRVIIRKFDLDPSNNEIIGVPTHDILKPFDDFFEVLKKDEISVLLIGFSIWNLVLRDMSNCKYRILADNSPLIINEFYNGIKVTLEKHGLTNEEKSIQDIVSVYLNISQYKTSSSFLIEPWREHF